MFDANVLARYSAFETQHSAFDPASIMLYPFAAELTEDGTGTSFNTTLSPGDIAFLREQYPR